MKICSKCKCPKDKCAFGKSSATKDGLYSWCKLCRSRFQTKKWTPENRIRHRFALWKLRLKREYGVEPELYEAILKSQGFRCAICGYERKEEDRRLCVDHNHETGKVRGILCNKCNVGIANFRESIEIMNSAISYLQQENVLLSEWL